MRTGLLMAVVLLLTATAASAWITPVDITNLPDYECGPRIVCDSSNNVHMVWYGGAADSSGWKIYYQVYNGSSWSAPVAISGSNASTPDIAIDASDNLHVVWHAGGNPEEIYYRKRAGGSWGSTVNVSGTPGSRSLTPRIALDGSGSDILVVWHEHGLTGGDNWEIAARKCTGGSWGPVENVSADSTLSRTADVVRDSHGNYHVGWEDTDTRRAYYRMRGSAGGWGAKVAMDVNSGRSYGVSLAIDSADQVHAVWHDDINDDWEISYRCLSGSSWGPVVNVSNNPGPIDCEAYVACDSSGGVYVVWKDYDNIYYAHRNANGWRPPYVISYGANQGSPVIFADNSNRFHLVWSSRMPGSWDVMWTWQDPDTSAPASAASFEADGSDGKVYLRWRNPSDLDHIGTMVRCKTTGYPTSPTDGDLVCDLKGNSGWEASHTHPNLTNGTTYYYSVFAYDSEPNYSAPAHASATPSRLTCSDVKTLADFASVDLVGKIVTGIFSSDGCIYVAEPNRASGIRITTSQTGLALGDRVSISGTMATRMVSNRPAERAITASKVTKTSSGVPMSPMAMACGSVGGAAVGSAIPGVQGGTGANNIGALIKIAGRVTKVLGSYIFVDDGSRVANVSGIGPEVGVMVRCPSTPSVSAGAMVSVTGIAEGSIPAGWTTNRRYIRMRDAADLVVISGG